MSNYKELYDKWLNSPALTEEEKLQLKSIENDEVEKEDRFYKELEFGTAGLRGKVGMGSNRMNRFIIARATKALAQTIIDNGLQEKGIAIAHDPRLFSKEFAKLAALVMASNGVKAYLFEDLRPTPELSFAVRYLGTASGINITASHNPKEYFLTSVYSLTSSSLFYVLIALLVVIGAIGTAVYSLILSFKPFLGKFDKNVLGNRKLRLPSIGIFISPAILVFFVIINTFIKDYIVVPAQQAALASNITKNEAITHVEHSFISSELITSIIVIIISAVIYKLYASRNVIYKYNPSIISVHGLYNSLGEQLHKGSGILHNTFITNELRRNMSYIFCTLSLTIIGGYFAIGRPVVINKFSTVHYMNVLLGICIVICCVALAYTYNRLVLIILSSGIGFMMTALYVTFRAPDLAMTQFVIESISTIIFLVAFILLTNRTKHIEKQPLKLTNAIIATITGISFTLIGLVTYAYKNPSEISQFYFDNVVASGGGNIVNVIIVDFRGFDTLFEITVMTMVALIIYAMFRILKRGGSKDED